MDYTIEVYKRDARLKEGRRLVSKHDVVNTSLSYLANHLVNRFYASEGWQVEVHETWVTKKNLMGGGEFRERYDTPHYCSPASESYWSM